MGPLTGRGWLISAMKNLCLANHEAEFAFMNMYGSWVYTGGVFLHNNDD